MLDRFLVAAEKAAIPAIRVCVNKIDLILDLAEARALFAEYERIGYPVLYVSAKTGAGIAALHDTLVGRISAFTGPSGCARPACSTPSSWTRPPRDRGQHGDDQVATPPAIAR